MEALLTPIPAIHIVDGEAVFAQHGRVAYGSDAWDLFARLRQEGRDIGLPVLIFSSATASEALAGQMALHKIVSVATLDGFEDSRAGKHSRPHLRPERAQDTDSGFPLFGEIVGLKRLERPANLSSVRTLQANSKKGRALTESHTNPSGFGSRTRR